MLRKIDVGLTRVKINRDLLSIFIDRVVWDIEPMVDDKPLTPQMLLVKNLCILSFGVECNIGN